jgi:opacity protein-like surface antigen
MGTISAPAGTTPISIMTRANPPLQAVKYETKQEFGWHFGGGVEFPVGSNFKLTANIRYVFLNYDFKKITGSGDLNSNFTVATVGLL